MQEPKRVQLSRKKGWRMPENTVSVARPGFWGNPHTVHRGQMHWDGETVDETGEHVLSGPWLCALRPDRLAGFWFATKAEAVAKAVELYRWKMTTKGIWGNAQRRLPELRGKNLACWCPLDQPCHADVLLELANKDVVNER
ncbi:DUF4326 domain-containing protein [Sphingomonas sp. NPDC019816]|uniref:DUF4326 domain-containing protein n=1 Tax=Sphingomonas sp. NPDC019816 TaxID=3390679 RepID=UPI003CFBCC36